MGTWWLLTTPATTGTAGGATGAGGALSKTCANVRYSAAAIANTVVGKAANKISFRFILFAPAGESGQQPGAAIPREPDLTCLVVEPSGNVPVTGHGGAAGVDGETPVVGRGAAIDGAMGDMNSGVTGGGGLVPASPSSVEPIGTPVRPTCDIDGAGFDGAAPVAPAQPLDADPAIPPPSNSAVAVCDVGPPVGERCQMIFPGHLRQRNFDPQDARERPLDLNVEAGQDRNAVPVLAVLIRIPGIPAAAKVMAVSSARGRARMWHFRSLRGGDTRRRKQRQDK